MLVESKNLKFTHPGLPTMAFPDISVDAGDPLLVLGKSGSGKTTLLNLLAGLHRPEYGTIRIAGKDLAKLSDAEMDVFRGKEIGVVFQKPHLLAVLNVRENLQMTHYFSKRDDQKIDHLLSELDLSAKAESSVPTLSEGEAQRVSIARALVNSPKLILADEPTSSLDDENTRKVVSLLQDQAKKINAALIIVTHDQRVKEHIPNFVEVGTS